LRARIETSTVIDVAPAEAASPASNGGRGLKQVHAAHDGHLVGASPASNGGRGLKPG